MDMRIKLSRLFNEPKFRELLLYIAAKCEYDRYYSATKLNKILFYSDFLAYRRLGRAITWADYFALEFGPAPAPLKSVRNDMEQHGEIALEKRKRQHRILPLRDPNLSLFTASEIAIVDEVIEALSKLNADRMSDLSHDFLGWKAARAEFLVTGKQIVIPYNTVFVSNEPLDEFEEVEGLELARQYGWPT